MLSITADNREPTRMVALLERLDITVTKRRLWAGDYEVGERAIVERKTVGGLHLGIVKGTLWPQLGRMRRVARLAYLLVEGPSIDEGAVSPAAIRSVCVAAMDLGIQIIRSENLADSAHWLLRLAHRRTGNTSASRPAYAQRPQRRAGYTAAEAALAAVPGISEKTAQALLAHFGSLAAVVKADPSEWETVRGIGDQKRRAMTATFHGRDPASGSRWNREPQDPST